MSFHLLSVQFCNYAVLCHKVLIQSGLCLQRISYMKWSEVAMVVDYPIMCGPCTNINILLFSGKKNNVITCHLLFVLDCRRSHSHCDRCIDMNN
jgi:hypothetical protein